MIPAHIHDVYGDLSDNNVENSDSELVTSLCISILLYADDIILLAQTEGNLQIMLNGLNDWCNKWKLRVNLKKSNIIHFRKKKMPKTQYKFQFNNEEMLKVNEYKYLGLIFNEFGTFGY